jgi:hypothetical protein
MKLHLTFDKADFENMRAFDKAVKRQLGPNVYVGSDSLCFYFDFPKELSAQLRPFAPQAEQFEFDLESSLPDKK